MTRRGRREFEPSLSFPSCRPCHALLTTAEPSPLSSPSLGLDPRPPHARRWKRSGEQYDDRVVEVVWDRTRETWRLLRFRDDKFEGNYKTVVSSIIRSIEHGVEAELLVAHAGRIKKAWKARQARREGGGAGAGAGAGGGLAQGLPPGHGQGQGQGHGYGQGAAPPPPVHGAGGYGGGGGGGGGLLRR